MIPFVVATSLATSSPVYLENEDRIAENVPLIVRKFFLKEHERERERERILQNIIARIAFEVICSIDNK